MIFVFLFFSIFGIFLVFFCFFLWYSLFFNNNIDTRNNKYKYKYRHRRMDFNHTSSHFTYAYDTNIHVWVWHEWEVWFELWLVPCIYLPPGPHWLQNKVMDLSPAAYIQELSITCRKPESESLLLKKKHHNEKIQCEATTSRSHENHNRILKRKWLGVPSAAIPKDI